MCRLSAPLQTYKHKQSKNGIKEIFFYRQSRITIKNIIQIWLRKKIADLKFIVVNRAYYHKR
jgi:hypothetical protein